MANYSYIEQPNRFSDNGQFWGYKSRRSEVDYLVIHTGEIAGDILGDDLTAENLTSYMGNNVRQVSWHETTDSDSVIHNLPHNFTGFHVARYNSRSIGIEQGIFASQWSKLPEAHVRSMIDNLALVTAWVCKRNDLPIKWLTGSEIVAGQQGITSHALLNPENRTDPGPDFPSGLYISLAKIHAEFEILGIGDEGDSVKSAQRKLAKAGYSTLVGTIDGDAGGKFDSAVRQAEADRGLSSTGLYTANRLADIDKSQDNSEPTPVTVDQTDTPEPLRLNAYVEFRRRGDIITLGPDDKISITVEV